MYNPQKGDRVHIRGMGGTWEVLQPADSDGEVSIRERDGSGWFYVDKSQVYETLAGEHERQKRNVETSSIPCRDPETPLSLRVESTPSSKDIGIWLSNNANTFSNTSNQEDINMSLASSRKVAVVSLIDPDSGLKPELALVKKFGTVVFDGSTENMKMKLVMDNDVAAILAKHNEKRAKEIDLQIRKSTGQELKLQPVELSDLQWVIDTQS